MTKQPRIPAIPGTYETLEGTVHDEYFGLRFLTDSALEAVLSPEDDFLSERRQSWASQADFLYAAARERLADQRTISYPTRTRDFLSFSVLEPGANHPTIFTAPLSASAQAISDGDLTGTLPLLDIALLAEQAGQAGYSLGDWDCRADGTGLVFTDCADGSEEYTLHIGLGAGSRLGPSNLAPELAYWDDDHLLLAELDEAHRPWRVVSYDLRTAECVELGRCEDAEFYYGFSVDPDRQWLTLYRSGHSASSCELFRREADGLTLVADTGLREGVRAGARARGDVAMFLYSFADGRTEVTDARTGELIAESDGAKTDIVSAGTDGKRLRLSVREGLSQGLVIRDGEQTWRIFSDSSSISMFDMQPGSDFLIFAESSWHAPARLMRFDFATQERTQVALTPVAAFDPALYTSSVQWVTARDGVQVPATIVHRTDQAFPAPAVVYSYGAYGIPLTPGFSAARAGLLDAGAVLVVAHLRGGGDLGRTWHEAGRRAEKLNTFHDLVDVVTALRANGVVSDVVIDGGSAGGATVSHAANLAPGLFAGVIAEVPFVDALATMSDASLPLTVGEYSEWGDPNTAEGLSWIKSWSPVDNIVSGQQYPPFYAAAGVNDPRVGFWEALKLAAHLRNAHPDNVVVVRTDRDAGHSGASARWEAVAQAADAWGFALACLGLPAPTAPLSA